MISTLDQNSQQKMMEEIDPNRDIPYYLVVKNADKHLYRNGLSFTPISDEKRRNLLFKPIVMFTVFGLNFIKSLVLILVPNDWRKVFVILGDFSYFINVGRVINITIVLGCANLMSTQFIYFYNYKKGIL